MSEAYVCDAVRTPIGRYAGGLSTVRTDDLAAIPIRALMARNAKADWGALDDVYFGCANQAGEDNRNVARMAALLAGLSTDVPATTINRLCSSSLDAIGTAARAIKCGETHFAIAGGVESMSRAPFVMPKSETPYGRAMEVHDTTIGWRFVNPQMKKLYGTDSMPETAENVATEFQISRADQDAYAYRSQMRYQAALKEGFFEGEIIAVPVRQARSEPKNLTSDEHPRADTTLESLAKLKAPFREGGTVTAGNASGVNDGACAMIIATEAVAKKHGLTPRARVLGMATAGVPPRVMGIGPVPSTRKLIERLGLELDAFDVIEANEAFAAQVLAVTRQLGLADDTTQVNPNGGAIAIGHPLGMSGARLVTTALNQLARSGGKRALCTMCVGVGQGVTLALERV